MLTIESKLKNLGFTLPEYPNPVAAYVPAKRTGNLIYISGQDCRINGRLPYKGKLGRDLTLEQGYSAARQAMINCLAVLNNFVEDINQIKQIVKLLGFVNSADGFIKQPYVINGASELIKQVFGERGTHARSSVAANELPFDTPVEIEMIVEVYPEITMKGK